MMMKTLRILLGITLLPVIAALWLTSFILKLLSGIVPYATAPIMTVLAILLVWELISQDMLNATIAGGCIAGVFVLTMAALFLAEGTMALASTVTRLAFG